jgi:hypothetical protein
MDCDRNKTNPFRMIAVFVAAMVTLTLAGAAIPVQAQTYTVLYDAPGAPGISNPTAQAIALGRDGNLYTTSPYGGIDYGTLFKIRPSGTVTVVNNTIIGFPASGVTLGTDGNFYGTNQDEGNTPPRVPSLPCSLAGDGSPAFSSSDF